MMTTLIFVRHGQSESNLQRRFTGQRETPLTELGKKQACKTAEDLKDYPIDRIYASDLGRAMETARPTAESHGLPIIPNPNFREIDAGLWEGMLYDEIKEVYPETYQQWLTNVGAAHPDGGEKVEDLATRVYAETRRVLEENRGKCVAIFTHATPVRMMGCLWHGMSPLGASKLPFCGNASVSIAEYEDDGSFRLICYGYDKHQGDCATKLPKNV